MNMFGMPGRARRWWGASPGCCGAPPPPPQHPAGQTPRTTMPALRTCCPSSAHWWRREERYFSDTAGWTASVGQSVSRRDFKFSPVALVGRAVQVAAQAGRAAEGGGGTGRGGRRLGCPQRPAGVRIAGRELCKYVAARDRGGDPALNGGAVSQLPVGICSCTSTRPSRPGTNSSQLPRARMAGQGRAAGTLGGGAGGVWQQRAYATQ